MSRDIHTVPVINRPPVWFYVYVQGNKVYVGPAKSAAPSCSISGCRFLEPDKFEIMLEIYHRREQGEKVGEEAKSITHNQVYWYGVFNDLNL